MTEVLNWLSANFGKAIFTLVGLYVLWVALKPVKPKEPDRGFEPLPPKDAGDERGR